MLARRGSPRREMHEVRLNVGFPAVPCIERRIEGSASEMFSAHILFSDEELNHGAVVQKEGALRVMIERMRM